MDSSASTEMVPTAYLRSALTKGTPLVEALALALHLETGRRYKLGVIRTSLRSAEVLERQAETGINVFSHLPDFQALGAVSDLENDPQWVTVRYCDLATGAGKGVVGYIGLVGETIFVAVHDSAVAGTLPPFPGDVAGLGRNAFTELTLTVALAGQITDFFAPTRERWWRSDQHGHRLLNGLTLNLPGVTIWDGLQPVDLSAAGSIGMAVNGSVSSSKAAGNKESALEKALNDLRDGRWPHASHFLPLGLRRVPKAGRGLSLQVELVDKEVAAVRTLLPMLAKGSSFADIGRKAAELGVPVPGPNGHSTTFADLPDDRLTATTKTLLAEKALSYWETGAWVHRSYTALTLDRVGGHKLEYDVTRRKRYKDTLLDKFPFPEGGFGLDAEGWAKVHERLKRESSARSRRRGAALGRGDRRSAFSGVSRWVVAEDNEEEAEFLFAPET